MGPRVQIKRHIAPERRVNSPRGPGSPAAGAFCICALGAAGRKGPAPGVRAGQRSPECAHGQMGSGGRPDDVRRDRHGASRLAARLWMAVDKPGNPPHAATDAALGVIEGTRAEIEAANAVTP